MRGVLEGWLARVAAAGRARRSARLERRAEGLAPDAVHELVDLQREGFVRARATGQSITMVFGEVENRLARKLRVQASPGTAFVAVGVHQNMVTRRPCRFTLEPGGRHRVSIEATCLNAGRPIPGTADRFDGVRPAQAAVKRFVDAAQDADPMVVQAGVWALTDGYSASDVQRRLEQSDRWGRRVSAVSTAQIEQARRILERLALPNRL